MSKRQTMQGLDPDVTDGLVSGDPHAVVEQKLVSAQNWVVAERATYNQALRRRADCIALARAAGWSKYRIAQRLGVTRRAVDEALERSSVDPAEFLAAEVAKNRGIESEADRRLADILARREN